MPPIETGDQAAEALAQANRGDGSTEVSGIVQPGEPAAPAAQPASPTEPPSGDPPAPAESFTTVDVGNLQIPEDPAEAHAFLQKRYEEMQAHFTQRTQEAAPWAKLGAELGVDPATAAESVRFAQALQNDPQYALAVHGELTQHLQQMGMTPVQAQAEATRQVREAAADPTGEFTPEGEPGEYVQAQEDPRIVELLQWREQMEQRMHMESYVNQALAEQARIQEADPSLVEADWERIWAIAPGVDGNLAQAHRMYAEMRNGVIEGFIGGKSRVPVPTPASGPAQQPTGIHNTEDATRAAAIRLAQEIADGQGTGPGIPVG